VREQRPRLAALEQHRPAVRVVLEERDGAVAVPDAQGLALVLGLPMRIDQLQGDRRAVVALGPHDVACGALRIGLAEPQRPLLGTVVQELRDALEPVAVRQTGVGHW
jgi:hypothetical protein